MKDRIIEMLGRGVDVSLVCTDRDAFIDSDPEFYEMNSSMSRFDYLVVNKASKFDCVMVSSPDMLYSFALMDSDLRYFKIKEPEYTFNDLIDVAVQAYKDGYIRLMRLDNDVLDISYNIDGDGLCGFLTSKTEESGYQFDQYIRDINSLYTETFLIESKEDMYRIGDEYEIVLSNGEDVSEIITITENYPYTSYGDRLIPVRFEFLKGATVTQKRGN